ncbi:MULTISPECIES: insertion element protein [unclassified Planococcus (in: firmicutes)]|uniref:insertion element protein n=1 Tax=unclassified Planococcus (in: firmicutes) TaxID=2662419 RepID=UPI0020B20B68|nr:MULTISPECIES: insertion element protein [unclassified Planococcus (in: firmicutes)]
MIYKRLLEYEEKVIKLIDPVTPTELNDRTNDYDSLPPSKFAFKRAKDAFRPIRFQWNGQLYEIQYNTCGNPLCKNHGLSQERFNIKFKPSRFKLDDRGEGKRVFCNPDRVEPDSPPTCGSRTTTVSNWSLAEEIERLIRINSLTPIEQEYNFHKTSCATETHTPKTNPKSFYKRGTNAAKAEQFQCKECKKYTNVSPNKTRNLTYNQKRNEILQMFAKLLINKTPINRTCEILDIGKGTYYQKLEWLYRCCLEFLETRETKPLAEKQFPEMWITTDKLHYVLNNVLKKGRGKNRGVLIEDKQLPTYMVASADKRSRYVFRSDICFDWEKSLDEISDDTKHFKEDHLHSFSRKNERFGIYSTAPCPPSKFDTQSMAEYHRDLNKFDKRRHYVEGLHVGQVYTSMAHFWLLKNSLSVDRWRFVSDDDGSLKASISRIFSDKIRTGYAHHFLCLTDKTLTRKQAKSEFIESVKELRKWAKAKGLKYDSLSEIALWQLQETMVVHKFHEKDVAPNGEIYYTQGKNRLKHPIPTSDRGHRLLDVLTDTHHLTNNQLAILLEQVNDNAINNFFQIVRRRLSILERPLVTARGDGKSYIYSNFNPKYSQMATTILRTYYNFCMPFKANDTELTPAQRLGIANRVYTWEDIIYKR